MSLLLVLAAAGAWLLLGAGLMKLRDPDGTGQAITVLTGATDTRLRARLLGSAEIVISLGFLAWPSALTAGVLGTAYLIVFGSAWALKERDADCGCFGAASSRVGTAHLVTTLGAALSALGLTLTDGGGQGVEEFALMAAAIPISLAAYALIAPMSQLRSGLADLRA